MKRLLYGVICIAFAGMLTACGGGNNNAGEDKADAGNDLFQKSCASCHGEDLKSGGAPDLDKIGSKYSKDEILNIINNGKGSMPAGLIKGADADTVAGWLANKK
jgi:mono/diheme cytochrome c family protein